MRQLCILLASSLLPAIPALAQTVCTVNGVSCQPSSFSGTTCVNCTMTDPVFTGTPTVNGSTIVTSPTLATAQGLAYFHRYANVTLTVPAVAIGGTGTATASVPGTAAGDQCFVAPTAATSLLSYIMAAGWVSVAGTVKVALAAPSIAAISSTTVTVNMLCAQ